MKTPITAGHPDLQRIVEALGLGDRMVSRLVLDLNAEAAATATITFCIDEDDASRLAQAVEVIGLCLDDVRRTGLLALPPGPGGGMNP